MRSGTLRKLISIQKPRKSLDDYGQCVDTWEEITTAWASIDPVTSKELLDNSMVAAQTSHKVCMRYQSSVTEIDTTCRIVWNARIFNVAAPPINTGERNRELQIMCIEVK